MMTISNIFSLAVVISLVLIPVARGAQYAVTVGGPGVLKFDPEFVTAEIGDTILFTFKQKNHTASQSSFDKPCALVDGGFDSGFVPVAANNTDGPFPAAALTVTDLNPVWVFCAQAGHCSAGMVFAVNPGEKFAAFQAAAMGNATTNSTTTSAAVSSTSSASSSSSPAVSSSAVVTSSASTSSSTVSSSVVATATASAIISFSSVASPTSTIGDASTPLALTSSSITPTSTPAISTSTSSAAPAIQSSSSNDHRVIVGGPGILAFSPSTVTAEIGDTVTFEFRQANHTITASSFSQPCVPLYETASSNIGAFDSGFMPVASDATSFPTYTIQVNNSLPVWAFCRQANHCESGMVFALNAVDTSPTNFDTFLERAKDMSTKSSDGNARARVSGAGAVLLSVVALLAGAFML